MLRPEVVVRRDEYGSHLLQVRIHVRTDVHEPNWPNMHILQAVNLSQRWVVPEDRAASKARAEKIAVKYRCWLHAWAAAAGVEVAL
jgi:hypothetical protein